MGRKKDIEGKRLVAVYGTLMRGERNRHWAEEANAHTVAEGTVAGEIYDTRHGYPAAYPGDGAARFAVELMITDDNGIAHMDILEGYPTLYDRRHVRVVTPAGEFEAQIYVMRRNPTDAGFIRIPDGEDGIADWREWRKANDYGRKRR